jgi:serine/threonine-protein kinase
MSPEQLRSAKHVDARSDVWSLGVIAYQLLTGDLPFSAADSAGMARAVLREEPRPIRARVPAVPAELAAVVERALRKDPAERPRNAGVFASALEPFAAPGSFRRVVTVATASAQRREAFAGAPARGDTHRDTPAFERRSPSRPRADGLALLRLALLGGGLGIVVSLLLHYLWRRGPF